LDDELDPFARTMADVSRRAAADVSRLAQRLQQLEASYAKLLAWLRVKPSPPMESDEFFDKWREFAEAVRLALPKVQPPPPQRQPTGRLHSLAGADSGAVLKHAQQGQPTLDPMMSRLRGLSSMPDPAATATGPKAPPTSGGAGRGAEVPPGQRTPQASKAREVDRKMQERLAARFAKVQAKASS
jgi:hypothetical protein